MYNESCNDEIYLTTLSEGEGALYVLFGAIESIVSPNHTGVDQDVLLLIEAYLIFFLLIYQVFAEAMHFGVRLSILILVKQIA